MPCRWRKKSGRGLDGNLAPTVQCRSRSHGGPWERGRMPLFSSGVNIFRNLLRIGKHEDAGEGAEIVVPESAGDNYEKGLRIWNIPITILRKNALRSKGY